MEVFPLLNFHFVFISYGSSKSFLVLGAKSVVIVVVFKMTSFFVNFHFTYQLP